MTTHDWEWKHSPQCVCHTLLIDGILWKRRVAFKEVILALMLWTFSNMLTYANATQFSVFKIHDSATYSFDQKVSPCRLVLKCIDIWHLQIQLTLKNVATFFPWIALRVGTNLVTIENHLRIAQELLNHQSTTGDAVQPRCNQHSFSSAFSNKSTFSAGNIATPVDYSIIALKVNEEKKSKNWSLGLFHKQPTRRPAVMRLVLYCKSKGVDFSLPHAFLSWVKILKSFSSTLIYQQV